jgi:hypothetical protein
MNSFAFEDVSAYGVLKKSFTNTNIDKAVEEINNIGYSVIHSGLKDVEINTIANQFDLLHTQYIHTYGHHYLKNIDEQNTIRLPLAFDRCFLEIAANQVILNILERLIVGQFILNQQNGIINPAGEKYNQSAWHRDLPYQHFVSSRPIAVSALFCVDDFTIENGATYVLPASHKHELFPSDTYILKNAIQTTAPAGSFIIIDCMVFHRGGNNQTKKNRRAINHVYTIPLIKQQIDIPATMSEENMSAHLRKLLGYKHKVSKTIDEFLKSRKIFSSFHASEALTDSVDLSQNKT